jgi:hypothetical protein
LARDRSFFQAARALILIERSANISRAMKSTRIAEAIAAREMAGKVLRPQGK